MTATLVTLSQCMKKHAHLKSHLRLYMFSSCRPSCYPTSFLLAFLFYSISQLSAGYCHFGSLASPVCPCYKLIGVWFSQRSRCHGKVRNGLPGQSSLRLIGPGRLGVGPGISYCCQVVKIFAFKCVQRPNRVGFSGDISISSHVHMSFD